MSNKIRVIRKRIGVKKFVAANLYVLFVVLSLFVTASYTWFTLSRTPRVSNIQVSLTSATGLMLSSDPTAEYPTDWDLQLNFWSTGALPTSLRPITWAEQDNCFWAAAYAADGRMMETEYWHKLRDDWNANNSGLDGYYIKSTFYARSDQGADVTFSPPVVMNEEGTEGSGTYVFGIPSWDVEGLLHLNSGKGAESSIRIGVRATPVAVNEYGNVYDLAEQGPMIIYEPNADKHVGDAEGYIPTPSIYGDATLVSEDRLILQKASGWGDLDPAEMTSIVLTLGDFYQDPPPTLFSISANEMMRIEMYLWLEGQDVDCVNAMNGAQLMANIQFADTGDHNYTPMDTIDQDAIPVS